MLRTVGAGVVGPGAAGALRCDKKLLRAISFLLALIRHRNGLGCSQVRLFVQLTVGLRLRLWRGVGCFARSYTSDSTTWMGISTAGERDGRRNDTRSSAPLSDRVFRSKRCLRGPPQVSFAPAQRAPRATTSERSLLEETEGWPAFTDARGKKRRKLKQSLIFSTHQTPLHFRFYGQFHFYLL